MQRQERYKLMSTKIQKESICANPGKQNQDSYYSGFGREYNLPVRLTEKHQMGLWVMNEIKKQVRMLLE